VHCMNNNIYSKCINSSVHLVVSCAWAHAIPEIKAMSNSTMNNYKCLLLEIYTTPFHSKL
jgi:hypothetical protein